MLKVVTKKLCLYSVAAFLLLSVGNSFAQGYGYANPGGYGIKIFKVESALYPYVQVYFRTFDQNQRPLVNLNAMNIGLMIKGRSYNPMKRQYNIQSIRQREEATRSVIVLDASLSMAGVPFNEARTAIGRFIDGKRPQDEVAILAVRDTATGYDQISGFERDSAALARRLNDVKADGKKTRLYDAVGAAMQMCGMSSQGSSVSPNLSNYIVSCSILVFSDGRDEGSALTRNELNTRITSLAIPVPIYSIAYSKVHTEYFKNLESLSKNSFGIYYGIGKSMTEMQRVVEDIQNIIQSDYVLTFRSYIEPDGETYALKVGVEYPTGSGKYIFDSTRFESIEPPPIESFQKYITFLNQQMPASPTGPYFDKPAAPAAPAAPAQ